MQDFDLFVIGGGSGGVRCARIAASHGAKVAIAEDRHWGGTCVNIGCVPKKLMVQAAEYGTFARDAVGFGWSESAPVHDWATLIDRKDDEIARLNGVYVRLLESAGVTMFNARASFIDAQTLLVGEQRVTAKNIVIAVGGAPVRAAVEGAELGVVSDDVFHLRTMPRRVAIIGAGYIAVEFAGIFAGLGAEVNLVFRGDLPLRGFDHDLRTALAEALVAQGVRVHAGAQPRRVDAVHGGQRRLELADGRTIDTDLVFFATGRAPLTAGLGLEQAGIATTPAGEIVTDALHATSAAGVYAIGDCTDALNLTPVAIAQGHRLADRLFSPGFQRDWAFAPVPTAVFSSPPIATCGLTEAEAAARGPADIYLARFTPMRHVLSGRNRKTLMKLVVDQASQRVVGAHMIGEDAGEMMQAIGIAMVAGATKADFDRTIGIHPTSAEEWVTLRTRTRVAGG